MTKRNTHYLAVRDGRLHINFAGTDYSAPAKTFNDEIKAAEALGRRIGITKRISVLLSSSCNHPSEYGRPGFDVDKFLDLVQTKIPKG